MLERLALALLVGGIAGYALAKRREETTDDIDWLAEWTIEVPAEHLRDENMIVQTPIEDYDG
jgi:hypothetical protein